MDPLLELVSVVYHDAVAVVTLNNPPVNALSHALRVDLSRMLTTLNADSSVRAIVLTCAGKSFSAGADLRELGNAPRPPAMGEVMRQMDDMAAILVAAIHGQALGGGLEVALICDYRIAARDTRLGLPEIKLGLMPGGGGTQRLPRLIGTEPALEMMLSGNAVSAGEALASGLIDEIVDGDLVEAAVQYAARLTGAAGGKRRLCAAAMPDDGGDFGERRAAALKDAKGLAAAGAIVDAVQAAVQLDFVSGLAREAELFAQCRASTQSTALRHLFAGEREVARLPNLSAAVKARAVKTVAVVGAGTMGSGVAISLLDSGYQVTLIETSQAALDRGMQAMIRHYEKLVVRATISSGARDERLGRLAPTLALEDARAAHLIIECVFEDITVKQTLFAALGDIANADAVLATNTSALDVDAIAQASCCPERVVGMHFFSPANIMRLVEVIRAEKTLPDILATAMAVAKSMNKIAVVSGVCDGFIGNRMIGGYLKQANLLLFEGAAPEQIDYALREFGMAMGPHAMGDMAGLDIQAAGRKRRRAEVKLFADEYFGEIADRLVEQGRYGLKTGKGMYRYEGSARSPLPDPAVGEIIRAEANRLGIAQRNFSDDEIVARCVLPLINEGARIIEEGIAFGAVDIDVVYCNGYGFPRMRGGPMFYADTLGLENIVSQMEDFSAAYGPRYWTVSPLLARLAREGKKFNALPRGARDFD